MQARDLRLKWSQQSAITLACRVSGNYAGRWSAEVDFVKGLWEASGHAERKGLIYERKNPGLEKCEDFFA